MLERFIRLLTIKVKEDMERNIFKEQIKDYSKKYKSCDTREIATNALTQKNINEVAINWGAYSKINHQFSNKISGELKKVTNQKQSGRCWGFAGLNLMRIEIAKNYNLENFEFSQNYFMFWDKLEKSNFFLENIISTRYESLDSRVVMWLLSNPIEDGGQWDMFVNLIEKYGAIPKDSMAESFQSSNSRMMNRLITRLLRQFACELREKYTKNDDSELRERKKEMLSTIYSLLCTFLGEPPTKIDWQFRDKKKKFHRFTNVDPIDFYKKMVGVELKNKICLIHCPMQDKSFDSLYTVKFLGNVVEGQIVRYVNLEIDRLKEYAFNSIKNDEAVWFGCDVGKMFNRNLGIMDMNIYSYDKLLGVDIDIGKQKRLEYGDSCMTHAMLFTGVDVIHKEFVKWRVENSWGDKPGDKGYYYMSDKWFDEYMYEIVIDKKYLSEDVVNLYKGEATELAPWDPMGSLAY